MKFDKWPKGSIAFILIAMLVWTGVVFYSIGFDVVGSVLRGESKAQIESFGQLGASYGVLAALFAGFAVVLLRQSINVQQEELHQLREQMEHDRDIRAYAWFIDVFRDARKGLQNELDISFGGILGVTVGANHCSQINRNEIISNAATNLIENRRRGNFLDKNSIDDFIEYYITNDDSKYLVINPYDNYMSAIKQIALFIHNKKYDYREYYLYMFASVTNQYDLILIHDQTLLRTDEYLKQLIECTCLLGVHGTDLYDVLEGGPRLKPSAFGIHTDEASD